MTLEFTVMAHCNTVSMRKSRILATSVAYLNVQCGTSQGERGVAQLWRASHVLASRLAEEDTLNLTTTIRHPKVRALLLVQVVYHDLVLDVVQEHGAAIAPD